MIANLKLVVLILITEEWSHESRARSQDEDIKNSIGNFSSDN